MTRTEVYKILLVLCLNQESLDEHVSKKNNYTLFIEKYQAKAFRCRRKMHAPINYREMDVNLKVINIHIISHGVQRCRNKTQ